MNDNPQFWIDALRTVMWCTDCNDKRRTIENAANALEAVIAERDASRAELQESALKVALIASRQEAELATLSERVEKLSDIITAAKQAILEMHHAHYDPNWYTGGKPKAEQYFRDWYGKATDAFATMEIDEAIKESA